MSILKHVSQIMVFHFAHFENEKDFWNILVKFIVYSFIILVHDLINLLRYED